MSDMGDKVVWSAWCVYCKQPIVFHLPSICPFCSADDEDYDWLCVYEQGTPSCVLVIGDEKNYENKRRF